MNKIICLWSCPRNVSTALMYSFSSREDTNVFDEALYGYYLTKSKSKHPGKDEIINSMQCNPEKVINEIILKNSSKVSFHKLMTHFLIDLDLSFLNNVTNIIFIREPREIIHSYHKVIPYPTIDDVGVKKQFELYNYLISQNIDVIVLDSRDLLIHPKKTLKKLCIQIGIPFDENMLKWKKGPKNEDGIWAKYWYKNVHQTDCFQKYEKKEIRLDSKNENLEKNCLFYYKKLKKNSLKI